MALLSRNGLSRGKVQELAESLITGGDAEIETYLTGLMDDRLPAYVENVDPRYITGAPFALAAANQAYFFKVSEPHQALTIGTMRYNCGTASGNLIMGYYESDGTTLTRLAASASTVVATGTNDVTIASPVEAPAENLYLAIICDNTTATFRGFASIGSLAGSESRILSLVVGSLSLPATVTIASATAVGSSVWLLGKA